MRAVLKALTDNGHHVTVFTPLPDGDRQDYTEVDISAEYFLSIGLTFQSLSSWFASTSILPIMMNKTRHYCKIVYDNDHMKEILSKGENSDYDLIVTEILFSSCVSYVAAILKRPIIYVVPSPLSAHLERDFYGPCPIPQSRLT